MPVVQETLCRKCYQVHTENPKKTFRDASCYFKTSCCKTVNKRKK